METTSAMRTDMFRPRCRNTALTCFLLAPVYVVVALDGLPLPGLREAAAQVVERALDLVLRELLGRQAAKEHRERLGREALVVGEEHLRRERLDEGDAAAREQRGRHLGDAFLRLGVAEPRHVAQEARDLRAQRLLVAHLADAAALLIRRAERAAVLAGVVAVRLPHMAELRLAERQAEEPLPQRLVLDARAARARGGNLLRREVRARDLRAQPLLR